MPKHIGKELAKDAIKYSFATKAHQQECKLQSFRFQFRIRIWLTPFATTDSRRKQQEQGQAGPW